MPVTRSTKQTSDESATTTEASGSATTTSSDATATTATETTATETTAAETTAAEATKNAEQATELQPAVMNPQEQQDRRSVRSKRINRKARRIAQAKEEVLRIELELAKARLACIETEDDSDDDTVISDVGAQQRVGSWLNATQEHRATLPQTNEIQDVRAPAEPPSVPVPPPPAPAAVVAAKRIEEPKKEENEYEKTSQVDVTKLASAIAVAARSGQTVKQVTELPLFFGSHTDWLSFNAAYRESSCMYSEIENMGRLRRSLNGRAKEAVENLLILNGTADDIMKTLEARFGRPDTIALSELDKLRALPRLNDSPKDICIFSSRMTNTVAALRALDRVHYLHSPETAKCIVDKMTTSMKYKWYEYSSLCSREDPELIKITKFLQNEARLCGPYAAPETSSAATESTGPPTRRLHKSYATTEKTSFKCPSCSRDGHILSQCTKFREADVNTRWDIVKSNRLCFGCLRYRGRQHNCQRRKCGEDNCKYWHNKLLHHHRTVDNPKTNTENNETVASTWTERKSQSYLKIVPVKVSGPAGEVNTYALLDDGSTVTLVESKIAQRTGAKGPAETLHIEAIADTKITATKSHRVSLKIQGTKESHAMHARTIENIQLSPQTINEADLEDCKHLSDIRRELAYGKIKPQILIGQDNWHLLIATEVRQGHRNQPVASLTALGWVLHGAHSRSLGQRVHFVNHIVTREDNMDEELKRYFAIESLSIEAKRPKNDPEKRALSQLEQHVKEREDGRYEAPLLWKTDDVVLPNNYENTLKRLYSVERKIDKDVDLKKRYNEQIEQLLEKGYAELAPPTKNTNRTWYLPHFDVKNPMKPDKLRIVHDAAAKTKGVSLNDNLLTGPDLLQSLPGVLMRFRQHPIAVSADVKEMFMQVKIIEEDRDAVRFLWRGDRRDDKPPQEYRMTSLIFGATCSPSTAIYVKDINAAKHRQQYPEAASAIIHNHYVDDYLHSFANKEEAIRVSKQVRDIQTKAHYELRQWTSNDREVIEALETDPGSRESVALHHETRIERVLGLIWRPASDELSFNLNLSRLPQNALDNERPTKRETLRLLMSVYDPLGLASPVTISGKRILQEVWRRGTGWDEHLDEELARRWVEWVAHLKSLRDISVPRCYPGYSQSDSLQLHVFVDASESTYAAALYWRVVTGGSKVHVSLIAAKAKVAPLKLTSIPRLELQAAVMGSRMAAAVLEEHNAKPESKTFWTDSRTVLTWIRTGSRSYRPFVAHRIAAIEENSSVNEWRWIPTKMNVADDATREVPRDLSCGHRWFRGPEHLYQDPSVWPTEQQKKIINTGEEKTNILRHSSDVAKLSEVIPTSTRFSKWEKLLRSTARVLQFIHLCQSKREKIHYKRNARNKERDSDYTQKKETKNRSSSTTEGTTIKRSTYIDLPTRFIFDAEKLLVRLVQEQSFKTEIENLNNNKEPSKNSRLRTTSTELRNGILVLKTRIGATAGVTEQQKHPPILDGNHYVTRLYIDYVHRQLHHAGVETTVNECNQYYWIVRVRPVTRETIRRCLACRRRKATPSEPPTGNHPPGRLAHHQRPFTYVGVDYFGPFTVVVGRTNKKRYVALFTCLTTRAVHLEVAASLSTESAVMALRRMIARRGCPTEIWSDNGTNLHGADRELRKAIDTATEAEANQKTISWRYIPPGAPFMGGAWERLVRSVKTALNTVLHDRHVSEEVLNTLLAEAEYTVNSRPLTHVSVDPEDPEAITPNHFLLHGSARVPVPGTFNDKDLVGRTQWRASQRLADMFWGRWLHEYLPGLQHRRAPHGKGPPLKEGDIVLVADNNLPRNTWPLGRIQKTYPGSDGVVRAVDVRTRGGVLRRPTKKLILMPTEPQPPAPRDTASPEGQCTAGGMCRTTAMYIS